MDVSSSYLSIKLLPANDILFVWGRKRSAKFNRYFAILITAAVQSNALLFAFGGIVTGAGSRVRLWDNVVVLKLV